MKFKSAVLVATLGASFLMGAGMCATQPVKPIARVLIAENQTSMRLWIKGGYRVQALPSLKVLKTGTKTATEIRPAPDGIWFGKEKWPVRGIRIEAAQIGDLALKQSRFRGTVDVLRDGNSKLYAVNRLDIESYLYGVLPHEVAPWWPLAALKAQAVAARTYALYQARANRAAEYDLRSDTSSQVYGGSDAEHLRTTNAVNQTAGEILISGSALFPAYFHATCAGRTAGASELWKIDVSALAGKVRCDFCWFSPHRRWRAEVPLSQIEEKMNQNGRGVGQILGIEVISQTPSGRVGSLRISGTLREEVIAAKDFRVWIGGDKMRSTAFRVRVSDDVAEFNGRGWGHGVGLCQWGALGQSFLGRNYREILAFYYPGVEIKKYDSLSLRGA